MDFGASQFAGGGFMPSQADTGAAGGSASKRANAGAQTLRAITVKQLCTATDNAIDDQFMIDGEEINNITLLGRIVSTDEAATCLSLRIDDGTGATDVRYWIDREDSQLLQQNKAQWVPDAYVRVHGNVRSFSNKRQVVAFNIKTVTDYNEVTFHFLQCIFQHEHIKSMGQGRGGAVPMAAFPTKPEPGFNNPTGPQQTNAGSSFPSDPNAIGNDGLTLYQRLCKQVFDAKECTDSDAGFTVSDVVSRLNGQVNLVQARDAVDFLSSECHIYTTTDDEHFKSTSA